MAGAVHFDPKIFERTVRVVGVDVPAKLVARAIQSLGDDLLKQTHVKPVQRGSTGDRRVLLLGEKHRSLSVGSGIVERLKRDLQLEEGAFSARMRAEPESDTAMDTSNAEAAGDDGAAAAAAAEAASVDTVWREVSLDYRSRPVEELLAHYLPAGMEVISGFETVGHIAHLNLRDAHEPFRAVIGEIILAKNPSLRTVVTKVANIKTKFRTFPMEVIAGDDDLIASVSESGCKFRVDFRNCYWNSRLAMEHTRLVSQLHPDDVICDMMAGIGPFAVPAAKKGCLVFANDLNPTSYKYLCENRDLNKISPKRLNAFNEDGAAFVQRLAGKGIRFTQVIMNLPATAYTFLKVFIGLFNNRPAAPDMSEFDDEQSLAGLSGKARAHARRVKKQLEEAKKAPRHWKQLERELPWIHCYGFSAAGDPKQDFLDLVKRTLGVETLPNSEVREVRDVAPTKRMILVSFPLPAEVAFADVPEAAGSKRLSDSDENPAEPKKRKPDPAA